MQRLERNEGNENYQTGETVGAELKLMVDSDIIGIKLFGCLESALGFGGACHSSFVSCRHIPPAKCPPGVAATLLVSQFLDALVPK